MKLNKKILVIGCQSKGIYRQLRVINEAERIINALKLSSGEKNVYCFNPLYRKLPKQTKADFVIIGGSTEHVYKAKPWMRDLEKFILRIVENNIPLLGICFGHQIIVKALGGEIIKNPCGKEFGPVKINLTKQGQQDPLFKNVSNQFMVSAGHLDIVNKIPKLDTKILAHNSICAVQSLAIGENIRTVQFHPEATRETMEHYINRSKTKLLSSGLLKNEQAYTSLIKKIKQSKEVETTGTQILRNFISFFHR